MSRHPAVLVKELEGTLAELAEADLDGVDAIGLGEVLVDLLGCENRLQAVCARVAGRVDASRVWANDGSRSCAGWLAGETGRDRSELSGIVGRGRDLRDMPRVEAEHDHGRLSARHVRLLSQAQRLAPEAFAADERWLVARARELTYRDFVKVIAYWRQLAAPDVVEDQARKRYDDRKVRLSGGLDGTGFLEAEFEPIGFGIFTEALRRIEQELWESDWAEARDRLGPDALKRDLARTDAQRRYDALIEMARRATAMPEGARKPIPLITVHIDHETATGRICELANGTVVTPGEVLPLLCCADIERAVFSGPDRVVNLGRQQRFFVGGTRRAVQILHPTCTHPTCDVPSTWCDIDHIIDWPDGGRTDQVNGRPRCPAHHPKRRQKNKAKRRRPKGSGREDPDEADSSE